MKISCLFCIFAVIMTSGISAEAQDFIPYRIPLYIFNIGKADPEYKVGIKLKIDAVSDGESSPWRMYEFDTGGTGFFAFPYSATENSVGDYSINYASGNLLTGNAQNTTITFESMHEAPQSTVTTHIGVITSASSPKPENSLNDWIFDLPEKPPLETYFYGDFGMGLGSLQPTEPSPTSPPLYAIIPQLAGPQNTGFIIHLGDVPDPDAPPGADGQIAMGWIQVGLTAHEAQASSWDSAVSMIPGTSGELFPHSNQPVYQEMLSNGTLNMTGVGPVSVGIVYDTGAPNTEIHPVGDTDPAVAADIQAALDAAASDPGTIHLGLDGEPKLTDGIGTILSYQIGTVSGENVAGISTQNVINSPGLYVNTGITAFFGHDVVFNIGDGFVGFNVVPEPATNALFGTSIVLFGWWMFRRRSRKH